MVYWFHIYLRNFLLSHNYIEVRTPVVCRFSDVAPVQQFSVNIPFDKTTEFYLRIAPTEFLKRLMQIGMSKIFEFSTNFRNDYYDKSHLPEFTSLEIMEMNCSVYDMMDLIENLCKTVYRQTISDGIENQLGSTFLQPWPRISLPEYLNMHYQVTHAEIQTYAGIKTLYKTIFKKDSDKNYCELWDEIITSISYLYETPVFIGDFPWDLGGPAKPSSKYTGYKERCELYYNGLELANMSSTLTDINRVTDWYNNTLIVKNGISDKQYVLDVNLMRAFELGIPPCAVVGIGIDRFIQLLLGKSNITDVICFCELKKEGRDI